MLAEGQSNALIAKELRVSVRSVQRGRRAWQNSGQKGLCSRGPASQLKLSEALFAVLEEELARGPVAHEVCPTGDGPTVTSVVTAQVPVRWRADAPGCAARTGWPKTWCHGQRATAKRALKKGAM